MNQPMRIDDAFNGLMIIASRLARVLIWCVFVITHLSIAVAALFYLWATGTSLAAMRAALEAALHSTTGVALAFAIAFLGTSAASTLWAYAKAWKWLLQKLLSAFLFYR